MTNIETVETPENRIMRVAGELGIAVTATFIPWSQSRNKKAKEPSLNWRVQLNKGATPIIETDYSAGSGHAPSYKQHWGRKTYDDVQRDKVVARECEHGVAGQFMETTDTIMRKYKATPIMPKSADVIHSLISDSDVIEHGSFESWANDFGYDTDSRDAEKTYNACLAIALKLRAGIGDDGIRKLREACQDY